ncbi:MAG: hypothetical protein WC887_02650 [Candidatus Paceibacterota bacterium]|jgi:hypothetical protein
MLGFISPISVHASTTSGTIDTTHKYAFSNVGGYVNFAPDKGGLTITDSAITGYAWSANTGWINFDTTQSGVTNDGEGTLGGFAWDSNAGWISFSGVTIDSSGQFHGQATGGTVNGVSYGINFECTSCVVSTDWRPASSRPSGSGGGSSSTLPRTTPTQTVTTVTTVSTAPEFPQEKGTVKKDSPQPIEPSISNGNIEAILSSAANYVENAVSSSVTQAKNIFSNLIHSIWYFVLSVGHFLLTVWHNFLMGILSLWHIVSTGILAFFHFFKF